MTAERKYNTFSSFYPFYLTQHSNRTNRNFHFIGTGVVITLFVLGVMNMDWHYFAALPFAGYGFAWVGHFFIEKNRPATFTYPFYSLASDFVMFFHILTFQITKKMKAAHQEVGQ